MVTTSVDDRLLAAYLFYGGILLLKMLLMSLITTFYRLKNKVCDIIAFLSTLLSKIAAQTRNHLLISVQLGSWLSHMHGNSDTVCCSFLDQKLQNSVEC